MYQPFNPRQTAVLQEAVQTIIQYVNPVAVWCFGFGKKTESNSNALFPTRDTKSKALHFYLLAFAQDIPANATADISNIIYDKSQGKAKVTLLLHSVLSFKKAFGNQEHFFLGIINEGLLVYSQKLLYKTYPVLPSRNYGDSQKYWLGRSATAQALSQSVTQMDEGNDTLKHSMLHIAVEQTCLGLIQIFLGYRPNHFALEYLFSICKLFTPLTTETFPRYTPQDKQIFALLSAHISQLRHATTNQTNSTQTQILLSRCQTFHHQATTIAQTKLNEHNTNTS
jgi:hypothetical protein